MTDFIGLGLSYVYILLSMATATLLLRWEKVDSRTARKIIHIAVGHWWFIAMYSMEATAVAVIGPASFIIINYLIARFHLLPAMESQGSNMGTVYYPISLLVLVLLSWQWGMPKWIGAMGIMIMAWGDGLAALSGQLAGEKTREIHIFGNRKTFAGSLAMAAISFLVVLILQFVFFRPIGIVAILTISLGMSILSTLVEFITPFGVDNITVPLISSLSYWLLVSNIYAV
jgi:phytol kinase